MGQIVYVTCPKCGYKTEMRLGMGIIYNRPNAVINLFDKETKEKVKKFFDEKKDISWMARKEIGVCRKCKKIADAAVLAVGEGKSYKRIIASKCNCGSELEIKNYDDVISKKEIIKCPECSSLLEIKPAGNWD